MCGPLRAHDTRRRAAETGWKRANREKVACSIVGLEVGLEENQKLKNCITILRAQTSHCSVSCKRARKNGRFSDPFFSCAIFAKSGIFAGDHSEAARRRQSFPSDFKSGKAAAQALEDGLISLLFLDLRASRACPRLVPASVVSPKCAAHRGPSVSRPNWTFDGDLASSENHRPIGSRRL